MGLLFCTLRGSPNRAASVLAVTTQFVVVGRRRRRFGLTQSITFPSDAGSVLSMYWFSTDCSLTPSTASFFVAAEPRVVGLARDPVAPARPGDVACHLLGVADDRQTTCRPAGELLLGHRSPLRSEDPMCTRTPSVPDSLVGRAGLEPATDGL